MIPKENQFERVLDIRPAEGTGIQPRVEQQAIGKGQQDGGHGIRGHGGDLARRDRRVQPSAHIRSAPVEGCREARAHLVHGQNVGPKISPNLDPPGIGHRFKHGPVEAPHPFEITQFGRVKVGHDPVEERRALVQKGEEQVLLAGEIAVEGALADARGGADFINGQIVESLRGGASPGGVNQYVAALLADLRRQTWQGVYPFCVAL